MSIARAVVIVASVTLAFAVALALVSRTPRSIRLDKPPANATDPSHGAHFTSEEIARNGRFRQTGYVAFVLGSALEILVLVVLGLGPLRRLAGAVESLPGIWALHAALVAAAAVVVITVTAMPLGYVTGYAMAKAWGLSTQNVAGWLSDQGRTLLIAMAISAITAVAFFGVVRWQPRLWWLFGWLAVSVIAVVVTYLYPVVISPLFNEFTPLHD